MSLLPLVSTATCGDAAGTVARLIGKAKLVRASPLTGLLVKTSSIGNSSDQRRLTWPALSVKRRRLSNEQPKNPLAKRIALSVPCGGTQSLAERLRVVDELKV